MDSFEIVDGCVKIDTFHHISKTRVNLFQDKTNWQSLDLMTE